MRFQTICLSSFSFLLSLRSRGTRDPTVAAVAGDRPTILPLGNRNEKRKPLFRISSEAVRLPRTEHKERKRVALSLRSTVVLEISHVSLDDRLAAFCKLNCYVRGWKGNVGPLAWLDAPQSVPGLCPPSFRRTPIVYHTLLAERKRDFKQLVLTQRGRAWSREYQSSGIGAHSGPGAAPQPQILSASLPLCVKNILRYPSTCANRNGLLRKRLLPGWRGLAGAPGKANLPIQTPCLRGSAHSVFERRRPMRCHVAVRNRIFACADTSNQRPAARGFCLSK